MKVFFDLFPVILFFIGFKLYDIFVATAIAIGATIAMIIYSKLRHGKVEKMLMVNGMIISVLGGITLLLHDKTFIMWKPTVLYWLFAAALIISNTFFKKNLIRKMMGKMLNPPASVWDKLNWVWVIFLVVLGFVNKRFI
ncbi:MAG: septation protein IspZ, partial [Methylophilaceae bacterium]|nr:septation protein IspZ [Methylophilaceae bacterium]